MSQATLRPPRIATSRRPGSWRRSASSSETPGPGDPLGLDRPGHVLWGRHLADGRQRVEAGQESAGEGTGAEDLGGTGPGAHHETGEERPGDVVGDRPAQGNTREVGDVAGDVAAIEDGDLEAAGVLAALGVVE